MTDIPQELVERVAEAVHLETMRPAISDDDAPTPKTVAETAIAAMLDGVTLEWGEIFSGGALFAETPFGEYCIDVEWWRGPDGEWFRDIVDPKAAALADYRQRMLKAMGS